MPIAKLSRRSLASLSLSLASALLCACGSGPEPPPRVKHEDPGAHVRRIATVWREQVEEEGLPDGDPEIAFFRVRADVRVELADGGAARESIERDELFRMKDGFEYHCVTKGVIAGH